MQRFGWVFAGAVLAMAGCSKQVVKPEEPVAQAPKPRPPAPKPAPAPAPPPVAEEETVPAPAPAPAPVAAPSEPAPPIVHFEFNSWYLDESARAALAQYADLFRTKKGKITLLIEGHADERGTAEYNIVLGQRRASAVRKYLANMGVNVKKLKTVSYGENKPASDGHDEQAYALNRRAEMKPQIAGK